MGGKCLHKKGVRLSKGSRTDFYSQFQLLATHATLGIQSSTTAIELLLQFTPSNRCSQCDVAVPGPPWFSTSTPRRVEQL